MKRKLTSKLMIAMLVMLTGFSMLSSASSLVITTYANETSEDRDRVESELDGYVDEDDDATDLIGKVVDDSGKEVKRNSISYVLQRVLIPGYINNVELGTIASELKNQDPRYDGSHICNPNEPQNLLNHNCDIPNLKSELFQAIIATLGSSGVQGHTRTQAKSAFGLGVPNNIPNGSVPIDPIQRTSKYTALEIFGYDLKYTTYHGEWDRISVSTESRVLTNLGLMDKLNMTGSAVWNGLAAGLGAAIEGFSWDPLRWASNIASSASGGALNTIIDTSELNVAASRGWTRKGFDDTLYNVKVLTDKEVVSESLMRYARTFTKNVSAEADRNPELQEVMKLQSPPEFTYDPLRETEQSIARRARAQSEYNEAYQRWLDDDSKGDAPILELPYKVYMTEAEQLDEWKDENASFLNRAEAVGIYNKDIKTYEEIVSNWEAEWLTYSKRMYDANTDLLQRIFDQVSNQALLKDPYLDPKQPISHYVCTDINGKPLVAQDGGYEYLYLSYNKGSQEYINPNCSPARPSVRGGLFAPAWHNEVSTDTRRAILNQIDATRIIPSLGDISGTITNWTNSISAFFTKVTNFVLGLSFSNIMEDLGLTAIISSLLTSFTESVFFPMSIMAAAFGAFFAIFAAFKGDYRTIFMTLITIITVFIVGTAVLINPNSTLRLIEEIPMTLENAIADTVISDTQGGKLCSVGDEQGGGIRATQCYIWNITTFQPWVRGQFGADYSELYANGYAPETGSSFTNQNQDLVGNAEVNMGAGIVENNWALYQLSLTKSGTITTKDTSSNANGTDSNIYKIVDLQAGPNNGALSDDRFLSAWAGIDGNRPWLSFVNMISTLFISIVVIIFSFAKIQYSVLVSIYILVLPMMLLGAMITRKGQIQLKSYISTIFTLILRRLLSLVLLLVLLLLLGVVSRTAGSPMETLLMTSVILIVFTMYRNELMQMFAQVDTSAFTGMASRAVPKSIQNRYHLAKANLKGRAAGFVGGAIGGAQHAKASGSKFIGGENSILKSMIHNATDGASVASVANERLIHNQIRKSGFGALEIYGQSQEEVFSDGAERIVEGREQVYADVYKEISSHSELGNKYRGTKDDLTYTDAKLLKDPRMQKLVVTEAIKRQAELEKENKDERANTMETEQASQEFDRIKRSSLSNTLKNLLTNPRAELKGLQQAQRAEQATKETSYQDIHKSFEKEFKDIYSEVEKEIKEEQE